MRPPAIIQDADATEQAFYRHRTLAEADRDRKRGCKCNIPLVRGHEAQCPLAGPVDYDMRGDYARRLQRLGIPRWKR